MERVIVEVGDSGFAQEVADSVIDVALVDRALLRTKIPAGGIQAIESVLGEFSAPGPDAIVDSGDIAQGLTPGCGTSLYNSRPLY